MDTRAIHKHIWAKMPAIDAGVESLIEVYPGHIALTYAKGNVVKNMFVDPVLRYLAIFSTLIILFSFWTTSLSKNYFTAKQTIMRVVDNNLTPTKADIRNGYDELWAEYYKKYKDPNYSFYGGPERAEKYLDAEVRYQYLMEGSVLLTVLFDLGLFSLGVGMFLWGCQKQTDVMTFNRETGRVTLRRLFGLKTYTADFHDDDSFRFRVKSSTYKYGNQIALGFYFPAYKYQYDFGIPYIDEYVSFLCHYMDRNRPLPDGTAFDPYREADFERRKAEGFPKPMYTSSIPMTDFDGKKRQL